MMMQICNELERNKKKNTKNEILNYKVVVTGIMQWPNRVVKIIECKYLFGRVVQHYITAAAVAVASNINTIEE